MPSVHDVAAFMIDRCGPLRAAKLHELVYYGQAWSLGLRGVELFPQPVHAWARGPVVYELLEQHRNRYTVKAVPTGSSAALSRDDAAFVETVLSGYRSLGSRRLTELTRSEPPWQAARAAVASGDDRSGEITVDRMREYYGRAVPPFGAARKPDAAAEESFATRAGRAASAAVSAYGAHAAMVLGVVATYALTRRT